MPTEKHTDKHMRTNEQTQMFKQLKPDWNSMMQHPLYAMAEVFCSNRTCFSIWCVIAFVTGNFSAGKIQFNLFWKKSIIWDIIQCGTANSRNSVAEIAERIRTTDANIFFRWEDQTVSASKQKQTSKTNKAKQREQNQTKADKPTKVSK